MLIIVRLVGMALVIMGIVFLISPKLFKCYVGTWEKGRRLQVVGLWRLLFGLIFLLAAPQAKLAAIIFVLGLLALIKGIVVFTLGREKAISIIKWWQTGPDIVMRLAGLLALAVGSLILYSV